MINRLQIAHELLHDTGSIWINIDSNENHYLKILLDNIFGNTNFINEVIWRKKYGIQNDAKYFSSNHDYILVYAKNIDNYTQNLLPRTAEQDKRYTTRDNDHRGPWKAENLYVGRVTEKDRYAITTPSGRIVTPPEGRSWVVNEQKFQELVDDNRIWFGLDGNNVPSIKRFLKEIKSGRTASTFWDYSEVGHTDGSKKELNKIFEGQSLFNHPKPERLLKQILTLGSNENDLVLDFFMGSSTTQAVAHKMNRRYIGIEQMEYINTVSVPRLQKVIEGEQGGISKDVDWQGGGSFVYVELMEKNRGFLTSVQNAKTTIELQDVFTFMLEEAEIDFRVDLEAVKETLPELSFNDQ